jgi:ankyrin repeat protein
MIYESDRNMPMSSVRNSYPWESQLGLQERACRAIEMENPELLLAAISDGAEIHHPVRPLLVEAAQRNKFSPVAQLLDMGAEVNRGDTNGVTALLVAAKCGNSDLIELLVKAGADINLSDKWKTTPLMEAVFHGHFGAVKLLIKKCAEVNAKNDEGLSVLAHVRHGRAAWEWARRRSHRSWRDTTSYRLLGDQEVREYLESDFASIQALDQLYQEIGAYLVLAGAIDCRTPIPFLTFPKKENDLLHAA